MFTALCQAFRETRCEEHKTSGMLRRRANLALVDPAKSELWRERRYQATRRASKIVRHFSAGDCFGIVCASQNILRWRAVQNLYFAHENAEKLFRCLFPACTDLP